VSGGSLPNQSETAIDREAHRHPVPLPEPRAALDVANWKVTVPERRSDIAIPSSR
jgi:hypothetical protein